MNFKTDDADMLEVAENNRKKFYLSVGFPERIILPHQIHGGDAVIVDAANWQNLPLGDGLITREENLALVATMADCFPLYFYDPIMHVIGLAHAGWRGILKGIVRKMVASFQKHFGVNGKNILMGIGPGIRSCHFVVKDDVVRLFGKYEKFISSSTGDYKIDLEGIVMSDAALAGVARVESLGVCTYCEETKYFSFRRDKPKIPHVMLAYIWQE